MVVSIVMGVPPCYGWFIRVNLVKTDDLGVPLFQETSIYDPRIYYMWILQAMYGYDIRILAIPTDRNPNVRYGLSATYGYTY